MRRDFSRCRFSVTFACLILGLAAGAPRAARGQFLQGTISGNVTDTSQAAIADAKIVVTEQATGLVRETETSAAGVYTMPNVPPGTYTVTVSASGFQPQTRTGVVVTVQTVTRVDVALTIGQVKESLTVSAEAGVLQTDRADVRFEIGEQNLSNLPVPIGRNYQNLFVTIPGVSPPQTAHSFAVNPTRALSFSVNGGNVNINDTRIDGAGTRCFNSMTFSSTCLGVM